MSPVKWKETKKERKMRVTRNAPPPFGMHACYLLHRETDRSDRICRDGGMEQEMPGKEKERRNGRGRESVDLGISPFFFEPEAEVHVLQVEASKPEGLERWATYLLSSSVPRTVGAYTAAVAGPSRQQVASSSQNEDTAKRLFIQIESASPKKGGQEGDL
ncbi:hypothetical protein K402DRAFT_402792 [Aulographum hederae CBS 113979]|uniref:Uncharacterized protein n=1 Tax=Aulographum hederae CBS 113979 TaxID=1176131 RepID=A0A6G1H5W8_9PEZI|nr:hypothetical protein K402DRAFT_402792 [Aulographum hederae CBS 113979]